MVRPNLTPIILPLAMFSAGIGNYFGLSSLPLILLAILLTLELLFGITAAYVEWKNKKLKKQRVRNTWFSQKKILGWGLKGFVLFFTLLILQSFKSQYVKSGRMIEAEVFQYIHSVFVIYIILVYLVSVYKKIGIITNSVKEYDALIKILKDGVDVLPGSGKLVSDVVKDLSNSSCKK